MRCACIDIGSNTTRLLVAELREGRLSEVLSQRVFLRLRGTLAEDALARVASTTAAQVEAARSAGADHVTIVGTAAIRGAVNGEDLCAAVHDSCGIEVSVLSGDDEARLAFDGATGTLAEPPGGTLAVVDVGGGSSEIVCGTARAGVTWSASLSVGSGTLADEHLHGDPPAAAELDAAREAATAAIDALAPPPAVAAYAVGGSATSLRRLLGPSIDRESLARATHALCAKPVAEVATEFDLHPERARVLPAGMLLLDAASVLLDLPLQIASGGLREGVLLERLRANPR